MNTVKEAVRDIERALGGSKHNVRVVDLQENKFIKGCYIALVMDRARRFVIGEFLYNTLDRTIIEME